MAAERSFVLISAADNWLGVINEYFAITWESKIFFCLCYYNFNFNEQLLAGERYV